MTFSRISSTSSISSRNSWSICCASVLNVIRFNVWSSKSLHNSICLLSSSVLTSMISENRSACVHWTSFARLPWARVLTHKLRQSQIMCVPSFASMTSFKTDRRIHSCMQTSCSICSGKERNIAGQSISCIRLPRK